MSRKELAARLRKIAGGYDGISQELFHAAQMVEQNSSFNLQDSMYSSVRMAETNTVRLREIAARMCRKDVGAFYDEVANLLSIGVENCDDWIKIRVPGILPNRSEYDSQTFLIRPFRHALVEFQNREGREKFHSCVICIEHTYDAALSIKRVRDYDNIETKRYLDVIESMFLTNDSGLLCSVLQTTKISDRDETVFYIMRPENFPQWVQKRLEKHTKS